MASLTTTKAVIALSWVFGGYSTWYLILNNGGIDKTNQILASYPVLLPGTKQPIKSRYTGIRAIDDQLVLLAVIFWETFDGSKPHLSLFAFMFAGQYIAAYSLLLIEGLRISNRNRMITFTVVWGLLAQNVIFACTLPLWALLHLSTSPTVNSRKAQDFIVNAPMVVSIPIAGAIGFILPGVLQSLPSPSMLSYDRKQIYMAFWQVFPLLIALLQQVIARLPLFRSTSLGKNPRNQSSQNSLKALRITYISALVCASTTRISTMTLVLISKLFPDLFASEYQGVFDPAKVFQAASITPATKMADVGDANLQLLQYDEMISGIVLFIWSVTLYLRADTREKTAERWIILAISALGVYAGAGAAGVSTVALWARDELMLGRVEEMKDA